MRTCSTVRTLGGLIETNSPHVAARRIIAAPEQGTLISSIIGIAIYIYLCVNINKNLRIL